MLGPSLPDLVGPGDRGGPGGGVLRSSDGKDGTDTLKGCLTGSDVWICRLNVEA